MPRRMQFLLVALLASPLLADAAIAQNPIASKLVGSDVARRNRKLLARFARPREDTEESKKSSVKLRALIAELREKMDVTKPLDELAPTVVMQRLAASEVQAYLKEASPVTIPQTDSVRQRVARGACIGLTLGARPEAPKELDTLAAVYQLELLCAAPELTSVVPNALRMTLADVEKLPAAGTAFRSKNLTTQDQIVDVLSWYALDRVLRAVERGHTNPQRWFLGGQLGLRLVGGDDDDGIAARASVRAAYFIPISPLRKWQLPVVTNLSDIAAAPKDDQDAKLKKITTSSEGAFLSLEPTSDPWTPGRFKDFRFQFFGAIGGQLNTLRDKADTSDVQFTQGRIGGGMNIEIGIPSDGRPNLFLTTRIVRRVYSPGASRRVFGDDRPGRGLIESFALIPIGAGTSVLAEVSAARGGPPVVRIALWAQATPQSSGGKSNGDSHD